MSRRGLARHNAKRDENEPKIVEALEAHGCVVWRLSGKGLPDLLVMRKRRVYLADVKMPGKPTTDPQEKAWEEAATKACCSVFILRTPEDAVKMLNDALPPWEPETSVEGKDFTTLPGGYKKRHRCGKNGCRRLRPCVTHDDTQTARRLMQENYTPPRSTFVDAAKEAEAFAPPVTEWRCDRHDDVDCLPCQRAGRHLPP